MFLFSRMFNFKEMLLYQFDQIMITAYIFHLYSIHSNKVELDNCGISL